MFRSKTFISLKERYRCCFKRSCPKIMENVGVCSTFVRFDVWVLFVFDITSQSRIFHSSGDVTITGERLQILTYDGHLWPLLGAVLDWHTYCNTGHPFLMVIRGPVTLAPVAERLAVELSLPVFTTYVCRDRGSIPDLPHTRQTFYHWSTAAVFGLSRGGLYATRGMAL